MNLIEHLPDWKLVVICDLVAGDYTFLDFLPFFVVTIH